MSMVICVHAVFIEKILREQPNVKKLYLLLRAADTNSAMLRFNTEVIYNQFISPTPYLNDISLG